MMNFRCLLSSFAALLLVASSAFAVNQPQSSPSDAIAPPAKGIPQAPQAQAPLIQAPLMAKTVYQAAPVYQAPVCTNCNKHRGWRRR